MLTSFTTDILVGDLNKMSTLNVRAIVFYLSQYHPITENDEWLEKDFTEWRNISELCQFFIGLYQPHLSVDKGFSSSQSAYLIAQAR